MPLELRWKLSGSVRPFWYGRYEVSGKRYCQNLGVRIAGTPPNSMSLKEEGDAAFERSRAAAQATLERIVEEARDKRNAAGLVEKLYQIKTGEPLKSVQLGHLAEKWTRIERRRKPNDRYAAQCQSTLSRFVQFMRTECPRSDDIAHVTRTAARVFLDSEMKRGITSKTWNDTLKLLRATFRHLLPAGAVNPFADIPTMELETVYRKPFTPEELKAIVQAAQNDEFIRPILVTGICTAMRRGDCCLLRWEHVDLPRGFITVKTAKTGVTVTIPIFPMLHEELSGWASMLGARANHEEYVFPEQAKMYLENPDGITWRVKKVLATALGAKPKNQLESKALPEVTTTEALRRGMEFLAKVNNPKKRQRMANVFMLYMEGKKSKEITSAAGISKGSASNYLNEIESHVGCKIVRGRPEPWSATAALKCDKALLRVERTNGKRAASVRDFHSFRVTWVTLALAAGVPLELVQKVTGHKTTDIVLKHYFQPGREEFRQALETAMPKLLTSGQERVGHRKRRLLRPKDKMREVMDRMTPKSWRKDKAHLLQLLRKI